MSNKLFKIEEQHMILFDPITQETRASILWDGRQLHLALSEDLEIYVHRVDIQSSDKKTNAEGT